MGEVINLRQARKARRRADDADRAQANRAKHGRSKAEKQHSALDERRLEAVLAGARREPEPE